MSRSGSVFPYEPMLTPPEEPPAKRQKTLACLRCRRRKQKCDEQRPCTNCAKSEETCLEVAPRLAVVSNAMPIMPLTQSLASPVDLCALEERVARLEKSHQSRGSRQQWRHDRDHHYHHNHNHRRSGSVSACSSTSSSHHAMPGLFHGPSGSLDSASPGLFHTHQAFSPDAVLHAGAPGPVAGAASGFGRWGESSVMNGHASWQQQQQKQQQTASHDSPPASGSGGGLATGSAPAIGLLATFARSDNSAASGSHANPGSSSSSNGAAAATPLSPATERALFDVYRARVHSRFAFLRLDAVQRQAQQKQQEPWAGFFANMIYSIGLLLLSHTATDTNTNTNTTTTATDDHQRFYRLAVTRHLSAVFAHPDRVLHAQAHLLLAMHALHSPSTERLVSVAGATMRYCVMAQLHLEPDDEGEVEEEGESALRAQLRRRVFWSAYALDRAVGAAFDLPPAVPDGHISTEMYADVDDAELGGWCAGEGVSPGTKPSEASGGGSPVSTALRLVRCLRIQSEVLDERLRRRRRNAAGKEEARRRHEWGLRVVEDLDAWRRGCADDRVPAWLLSARDAGVAMLLGLAPPPPVSPGGSEEQASDDAEKAVVKDDDDDDEEKSSQAPAAAASKTERASETPTTTIPSLDQLALEACARACTDLGRRSRRRSRSSHHCTDEPWLAPIAQFRCGVALLHAAAFPPPPPATTAVPAAAAATVRACAASLAAFAERWPQSRCLRDVFAALAAKVGVSVDDGSATTRKRKRAWPEPAAAAAAAAADILAQLPDVAAIVVHRATLGMVRDLAAKEIVGCPALLQASDEEVAAEEEEEEVVEGDERGQEAESYEGEEDGEGLYDVLNPAFLLPETAPARRDSRYDYLDFGEPDDTRPWLDDGLVLQGAA